MPTHAPMATESAVGTLSVATTKPLGSVVTLVVNGDRCGQR
jgi:hypothetical protein